MQAAPKDRVHHELFAHNVAPSGACLSVGLAAPALLSRVPRRPILPPPLFGNGQEQRCGSRAGVRAGLYRSAALEAALAGRLPRQRRGRPGQGARLDSLVLAGLVRQTCRPAASSRKSASWPPRPSSTRPNGTPFTRSCGSTSVPSMPARSRRSPTSARAGKGRNHAELPGQLANSIYAPPQGNALAADVRNRHVDQVDVLLSVNCAAAVKKAR